MAKIIVVGSGIAGLACARSLKDAGHEVTVLEAKDRIGGRLHSAEAFGTFVDLGASWIHGITGNPITTLAEGIETKATDYDLLYLYDYNGNKFPDSDIEEIFESCAWVMEKAEDAAEDSDEDVAMGHCINKVADSEGLDWEERQILNWFISNDELNQAADYAVLSTWEGSEDGFDGPDVLFPGGFAKILDKLTPGVEIKTEAVVTGVNQTENDVTVSFVTTAGAQDLTADAAVLACSLGVLKKGTINITPPLPSGKQTAVSRLEMGCMEKVALEFDEIFWPTDRPFLGYISKDKGEFPIFSNWAYYTGKPVLLSLLPPGYAPVFLTRPENEQLGIIHGVLKNMFGPDTPAPTAMQTSNWWTDAFTYGSYSYIPVGGKNSDREVLAAPYERLFFCGEATHADYPATVHGAYLSGRRAADEILGEL